MQVFQCPYCPWQPYWLSEFENQLSWQIFEISLWEEAETPFPAGKDGLAREGWEGAVSLSAALWLLFCKHRGSSFLPKLSGAIFKAPGSRSSRPAVAVLVEWRSCCSAFWVHTRKFWYNERGTLQCDTFGLCWLHISGVSCAAWCFWLQKSVFVALKNGS